MCLLTKTWFTQGSALLSQCESGGETVLTAIGLSDDETMHSAATALHGESVAHPFRSLDPSLVLISSSIHPIVYSLSGCALGHSGLLRT